MAANKQGGPTGSERMKRLMPRDLPPRARRVEFDPIKAYQKKQLAQIGAISILWNQVEALIHHLGSFILFRTSPFQVQLEAQKTISLNSKLALLKSCLKASKPKMLDAEAKQCIELSLAAVAEYATFRNAVIHHQIDDHKKGVGAFVNENGKAYQIMVSYEALSGLYKRLELLRQEIIHCDMLLRIELQGTDAAIMIDPSTGLPELDQPTALRERGVPEATMGVLRYQRERLSLPPLPLFPDARRFRPRKAGAKSRRRPSEKDRKDQG